MTSRILPVVLTLCALGWAQQPQPQRQSAGQSRLGTMRDDRKATVPQSTTQTASNAQNELVGCVSQHGNKYVLMQPRERRWYELRGDQSQLQSNVGKMVKVTGQLVLGQTSAFNVRQLQPVQDKCEYEASNKPLPATGKTGAQGKAETVTSTATVEQVTPGVETQRGIAQDPGKGGHNPARVAHPTASQAAPPNPNVQNPADAQRIANAAQQSELSNQTQLGVNAQPNYSNSTNPQANAQAVANTARQERGQAAASDQVFKGGEKQAPAGQKPPANQNSGDSPVLTGCLAQEGNQFWLTQQGTGTKLRVEGDASKLKDHLNHTVQIVASKTGTYGPAVGTSGDTETWHVQAIQDVSPTCQK